MVNHMREPIFARWFACCRSVRWQQDGDKRPLTFEDGLVMENWYPRGHQRGIEGPSEFDNANSGRGKQDLEYFDEYWEHAVPIELPLERFNWHFSKQYSSNK
jgi:hypothetical protein